VRPHQHLRAAMGAAGDHSSAVGGEVLKLMSARPKPKAWKYPLYGQKTVDDLGKTPKYAKSFVLYVIRHYHPPD